MTEFNAKDRYGASPIRFDNAVNNAVYYGKRLDVMERHGCFAGASRVLDIGCGDARISHFLHERLPEVEFYGIDFFTSVLVHARDKGIPGAFATAEAQAIPFADGAFDMVMINNVLHHLDERQMVLDEALRVCRSGGRLVVIEPNRLNPLVILLSLLKANERGQMSQTRAAVVALLGDGVESLEMASINSFIYPAQKLPSPKYTGLFEKLENAPLIPPFLRSHFVVMARKKPAPQ